MSETIGVGIIGVNPDRGWAATAHIPALRALPNFKVNALSTTRQESADAAGVAFGVPHAFADHNELVSRPDVDLVVVAVKAPHHFELVSAALKAGKSVYSEWPLGIDLAQTQAMAELAAQKGSRTVVGLQARNAPVIQYARDLIAGGYVGEVLSTTMVGVQIPGDQVIQPNAYMLNDANGANLLTIGIGHGVDALSFVLGEFNELSAVSALRRPHMRIAETGQQLIKSSADQIAIIGTLASGATAAVHYRDAVDGGTGFLWEINGTAGTLTITASGGHPGIFPLTLSGARGGEPSAEIELPATYDQEVPSLSALAGHPAYNVGRTYAAFARELADGTNDTSFSHALARHKMIAAIEESAASGRKIRLG